MRTPEPPPEITPAAAPRLRDVPLDSPLGSLLVQALGGLVEGIKHDRAAREAAAGVTQEVLPC